jgi:putative ABC transport system ATP-binding protein
MGPESLLKAENVTCRRALHGEQVSVVESISLEVERNGFLMLHGPPGCGKVLLLHLLGLLTPPDAGEVYVEGHPTSSLPEEERTKLRHQRFGYIFPIPYLLPALTVAENVAMPLFKARDVDMDQAAQRTEEMMEMTGLKGLEDRRADRLTKVQEKYAALARALAHAPAVLIAQDPANGLSGREREEFLHRFVSIVRDSATTVAWCSETAEFRESHVRVVGLSAGRILPDAPVSYFAGWAS